MGGDRLLDDVDSALLAGLRADGRRSYLQLAADAGVSPYTARRRVQHLLDTGVARVAVRVNRDVVEGARQAVIGLSVEGSTDPVLEAAGALVGLDGVVPCTGVYDVLAWVSFQDERELLRVVSEDIRALRGVRRAEVFFPLRTVKDTRG
ncbi:Lrp/AsnC family transcriptional regulator [Micromonospora coxensis]|uniref:Lrp/AsnC family transcriptional regulator, regulator for asnA, asnC and gidA n=1 Tax=Micromonospora coxensis TaxID=356852 RepID=A0A1C5H2L5_9ACTN|nr:Lrp/AsnC family transcriptional regulator [Micromonospora coxensis]SCG40276.1 Lrp/AsnC family transcriptional regulator, regulator for asnA, asnC and gidA [Micromonospora coxensis]